MSKLFIPILFCATTALYGQQQYKGVLQYSDQTPVGLVDLIIIKDDNIIEEILTDEKGFFSTELIPGSYTLSI